MRPALVTESALAVTVTELVPAVDSRNRPAVELKVTTRLAASSGIVAIRRTVSLPSAAMLERAAVTLMIAWRAMVSGFGSRGLVSFLHAETRASSATAR